MSATQYTPALLRVIERVGDLKVLPRTGWLLANVADVESVADHTAGVALISLFIAEAINTDLVDQGLSQPLDIGVVVQMALIHDLAESVLTDLPKRASRYLGEEIKHQTEAAITAEIINLLPNGARYLDLWHAYVAASTPEARLVKDVDKLEMVAQALRYTVRGQQNLREFWEGHQWAFPLCRMLYESLLQQCLPRSST